MANKTWTVEEIKELLETNDTMLYRSLNILYKHQTDAEKIGKQTYEANGRGFNKYDAEFMSSICESLNKWGRLTDKQKFYARKRIMKYVKQLTKIANER